MKKVLYFALFVFAIAICVSCSLDLERMDLVGKWVYVDYSPYGQENTRREYVFNDDGTFSFRSFYSGKEKESNAGKWSHSNGKLDLKGDDGAEKSDITYGDGWSIKFPASPGGKALIGGYEFDEITPEVKYSRSEGPKDLGEYQRAKDITVVINENKTKCTLAYAVKYTKNDEVFHSYTWTFAYDLEKSGGVYLMKNCVQVKADVLTAYSIINSDSISIDSNASTTRTYTREK